VDPAVPTTFPVAAAAAGEAALAGLAATAAARVFFCDSRVGNGVMAARLFFFCFCSFLN